MKLLFENWRRYVKEARDRPIPFQTLHSYERGPSVQDRYRKIAGVSYQQIEQPEFVESVKTLFDKTEDNWVIVVLDDTHKIKDVVNENYFKKWLASKNYPKDSKILVVGSAPYGGDFTSSEWIVHDIIGHTVGRLFLNEKSKFYEGAQGWLTNTQGADRMLMIVHNYLVKNNRPVTKANILFDMIYDVFASIILKDLTREDIERMPNLNDEQKIILNEIFDFCERWIASIPSDNTQVTVLDLW